MTRSQFGRSWPTRLLMETPAEARIAGRAGAALFAGAGALTLINSFATTSLAASGVDLAILRAYGVLGLVSAVLMWYFPWPRVPALARLVPAVWGIVILIGSGYSARYAASSQAATAYPVFFMLILAWLGLTQGRGIAAAFSCLIVACCVWLSVTMPTVAVPLSGMVVATATAALVGETIAFVAERNRRHTRKLGALSEATSELRDVLSFDEGVVRAVDAIRTILGADEVTFSSSPVGQDADSENQSDDAQAARPAPDRHELAIPLNGPSGPIGVARVAGVKLDPFTDQLIQIMSNDLGGRLEQLRVLEVLGEHSFSDALTGVGNRRHADKLTAQLAPGDAVILIDVDNFKHVNDQSGHRAGDRLLEQVAAHLKRLLREDDVVARYGGDEFVVRLNPRHGSAQQIAERLLDSWLESHPAATFSVGVAVHPPDADPHTTFALADAALYEAKNTGRARVCCASDLTLPR